MNHRQRFAAAMQHQTPDRAPIDIGATSLTGMRPECQRRLSDLLGFSGQFYSPTTKPNLRKET